MTKGKGARGRAKQPTAVDAYIAKSIRLRRKELGLTQTALAERLGVVFHQVQKYENGTNRVSAARLPEFGAILQVPLSYFFPPASFIQGSAEDLLRSTPRAEDLLRAYADIEKPSQREALCDIAAALASYKNESDTKRQAVGRANVRQRRVVKSALKKLPKRT